MTVFDEGPRLLYLTGWGRSGSTVLETVLGASDARGISSAGQLAQLWTRPPELTRCQCGRAFLDCPVWSDIRASFDGDWPQEIAEMNRIYKAVRVASLPAVVGFRPTGHSTARDLGYYRDTVWRLYSLLATAMGVPRVLDASKSAAHLAMVNGVSGVDVRVIHLVRDPRRVIASWKRGRASRPGVHPGQLPKMAKPPQFGVAESARRWTQANLLSAAVMRSMRIVGVRLPFSSVTDAPIGSWTEDMSIALDLPDLAVALCRAHSADGLRPADGHGIGGNGSVVGLDVLRIEPDRVNYDGLRRGERLAGEVLYRLFRPWLDEPRLEPAAVRLLETGVGRRPRA